jgi:hypothetical protein
MRTNGFLGSGNGSPGQQPNTADATMTIDIPVAVPGGEPSCFCIVATVSGTVPGQPFEIWGYAGLPF